MFKLREDADPQEYERWAIDRDAPVVRDLPSVDSFTVHRIKGTLDGEAPYDYVEIVDVADMDQFGKDISGGEMATVAGEFTKFTSGPIFMVSEPLEPPA
jgi:hypothetical protein